MTFPTLASISVKGFRSIASMDVTLRPINLMIGANGAGKSNFIGVFSFLRAIAEGRLQNYVRENGGADQILHFGSKKTENIEFQLSFRIHEIDTYRLILGITVEDNLYVKRELTNSSNDTGDSEVEFIRPQGLEAGISRDTIGLGLTAVRIKSLLRDWHAYHINDTSNTSAIRRTAKLNDNHFLRPDGENLASFLYLLKKKYKNSYSLIRKVVQRALPFFDDFQLKPDSLNEEFIRLSWRHKNSDQYFGASALSDGSLRFVFLATLLLRPEALRPPIILVDEPEMGLHPAALGLLASLIKQASTETQIIVSTQSPSLLDYFEPEDVLVAERYDGGTEIKRLDADRLKTWLEDYSLGELWEKNELGGRPRPD